MNISPNWVSSVAYLWRVNVRFKTNVVLVVLFSLGILAAQEFRASVSGHVTDSTGAVVPLAKVQATNLATKETSSAITDNSGSYTIPLLQPGMYRLTVQATGFKQYVLRQRVDIFFKLRERAHPDAFKQGFARVYRVLELERG
jgi:hypothetical protein